ncbi:MAG: hypothetical protein DRO95_03565 [Candidatus Altiarchaeales archaeon]|nr:MAG: hypothetical protein DRO95_03565 [Candidatus Altiarchaeales archaeon]
MFSLPYVPTAEELIDNAFREGAKVARSLRSIRAPRETRLYKSEEKRVERVAKIIESSLNSIVKNFPSYEQLPRFYRRLIDIRIDKDRYKRSLGAVNWCLNSIKKLKSETLHEMRKTRDGKLSRQFLGRAASFIRQISGDLDELIKIKEILREFPIIEKIPTIVIAGYPNAGKSTFMTTLTDSKVEIANYPFTTKSIMLGYKTYNDRRYQIIDSPGLLDRPIERRNEIELQAILAIEELADFIIFLIDPFSQLERQLLLLNEIRKNFKRRIVVAINKKDIANDKLIMELKKELREFSPLIISAKDKNDCEFVLKRVLDVDPIT